MVVLCAKSEVRRFTPHSLSLFPSGLDDQEPMTLEEIGSLLGITRETVLQLAQESKIPTIEKALTRDDLYLADEIFLTGTAAEITPVRELDHRQIGQGQRGPVTERLQELYQQAYLGKTSHAPQWLTAVT